MLVVLGYAIGTVMCTVIVSSDSPKHGYQTDLPTCPKINVQDWGKAKLCSSDNPEKPQKFTQLKRSVQQLNATVLELNKTICQTRDAQMSTNALKQEMASLEMVFQVNISRHDAALSKSIRKLGRQLRFRIRKTVENFRSVSIKLSGDHVQFRGHVEEITRELNDSIKTVERLVLKVSDDQSKLLDDAEKMKDELDSHVSKQTEENEKRNVQFSQHQDETKKMTKSLKDLEKKIEANSKGDSQLNQELETIQLKVTEYKGKTEVLLSSHQEQLNTLFETNQHLKEELEDLKKLFQESSQEQSKKLNKAFTRTVETASEIRNKADFSNLIYTAGILITTFCVVLYVVTSHLTGVVHRSNQQSLNNSSRISPPVNSSDVQATGQQRRSKKKQEAENLIPSVLVVGFFQSSISSHVNVASAVSPANVPVFQFVVNDMSSLNDIPTSSVAMVFVDFNERNVILEEPGLIQGELRVKTVEYLQQMAAEVFVVYAGDRGSDLLPAAALYNSTLTSIYRHNVLSGLERKKRVLSINKCFNETQKGHVMPTIQRLCQT